VTKPHTPEALKCYPRAAALSVYSGSSSSSPPPPPVKRKRGRQEFYADKLFVKALLVMIIRRLYTAYALLSFLDQDDPVAHQIRPLLTEHGRCPTRRTWERRFGTLPARLPALIGCLGRHLGTLLQPWAAQGHAAAVASTPLRQPFPAKAYAIENKWLIPSDFRKHKANRINNICILCRWQCGKF
jgi:hypothetical protein